LLAIEREFQRTKVCLFLDFVCKIGRLPIVITGDDIHMVRVLIVDMYVLCKFFRCWFGVGYGFQRPLSTLDAELDRWCGTVWKWHPICETIFASRFKMIAKQTYCKKIHQLRYLCGPWTCIFSYAPTPHKIRNTQSLPAS
jgi:hypothetical protein